MRISIEIDDNLMAPAMRASGAKTKRATIEAALRPLIGAGASQADTSWASALVAEGVRIGTAASLRVRNGP